MNLFCVFCRNFVKKSAIAKQNTVLSSLQPQLPSHLNKLKFRQIFKCL